MDQAALTWNQPWSRESNYLR